MDHIDKDAKYTFKLKGGSEVRIGYSIGPLIDLKSVDINDPEVRSELDFVRENYDYLVAEFGFYHLTIDQDRTAYRGLGETKTIRESILGSDKIYTLSQYVKEFHKANEGRFYDIGEDARDFGLEIEARLKELETEEQRQYFARLQGKYPERLDGYVYLIRIETGQYKIGYSKDPEVRSKQIIGPLPVEIEVLHTIPTNQMACAESELHGRFYRSRFGKTEWFELSDEDVEYIRAITEKKYPWLIEENEDLQESA
jgi:hypothetical protein